MWRINWRVKGTGYEGHGLPIFVTKDDAKRICEKANLAFPEAEHWPEEVEVA